MLVIKFVNDGTGDELEGNYNYKVQVNNRTIVKGRIEKHNRLTGWQGLVLCLAKSTEKGAT